jgi:LacI family transcriptional regulator
MNKINRKKQQNKGKSTQKIRIKDIAFKANVSIGTVDRVLHNRGEVSEDTKKIILDIIAEYNYQPNLLARSLASKKSKTIAVILPDASLDNPYWENPFKGIQKAEFELKDFNVIIDYYYFDLNDEQSFINQLIKLENQPIDAVVFAPFFYNSSIIYSARFEAKEIPYVFIDINIENQNNLAYFGQDAIQSGMLAAKLMAYGISDAATILVVKLAKKEGNINHLIKREKGFISYFNSDTHQKNRKIISCEIDMNNHTNLCHTINELINAYQGLEGIFVTNSRVYLVAECIVKLMANDNKITKSPILIGYDLIKPNIEHLKKGNIDFLICQKPEDQAYKAIMAVFNYLNLKGNYQKTNYSPIDIITKENYDFYL